MACLRGEATERARRPAPAAPRAGFCLDLAPALTDRPPQPRHSTTTTLIKNSASVREKNMRCLGGPQEAWRCGHCSFRRDTGKQFWYESQKIFLLTALTTAPPQRRTRTVFVRLMITKKKVSRGGCERVPSGQQQVPWSVRTATSTVLVQFGTAASLRKSLQLFVVTPPSFLIRRRAHDRGDRFGEAEKTPSRVSHEHTTTTAQQHGISAGVRRRRCVRRLPKESGALV